MTGVTGVAGVAVCAAAAVLLTGCGSAEPKPAGESERPAASASASSAPAKAGGATLEVTPEVGGTGPDGKLQQAPCVIKVDGKKVAESDGGTTVKGCSYTIK
ncbi:hypothetical protein ACFY04_00865 [Streptomyces sp. NPDC001549]|uniref:hypothetical protein n=1 Tax=Streptomyces sp. NPDC001549 TaxID=3364586 RepID=UPI00367517F2